MNNDITLIDKFLKKIAEEAKKGRVIDNNIVYGTLTRLGTRVVNDKDISKHFSKWQAYFKNSSMNVDYYGSQRNFLHFINDKHFVNYNQVIKMYIPIDDEHIEEAAKRIFKFMDDNNINHQSKISSKIRFDDIVIRIYDKKDAQRIRNFVLNDNYIRKGIMRPNPFACNDGFISYTWDNNSSYNDTVANYIVTYINRLKKYNMLDSASYRDFYIFVANTYKDVFENGNGLSEYIKNMDLTSGEEKMSAKLMTCEGITRMLLTGMDPRDKDTTAYFKKYDEISNPNRIARIEDKMDDFIKNGPREKEPTKRSPETDKDKELDKYIPLWNKVYQRLIEKYGNTEADLIILRVIQTGNYDYLTRQNNIRASVINSGITPDMLKDLMIKMRRKKIDDLAFASRNTYFKYGTEQIYQALVNSTSDYFKNFTNQSNGREVIEQSIKGDEIRGLLVAWLLDGGMEPTAIPEELDEIIGIYIESFEKRKVARR